MSAELFSQTQVPFSQDDQPSVFYAHLKNLLLDLISAGQRKDYAMAENTVKKMDSVLFDVYFQFQKMQTQHYSTSKSLKQLLTDCSRLMEECKSDRQKLVKVTEDRQQILQKLKRSTDTSLELVQQNQRLCEEKGKLKDLNQLLLEKSQVLEEQVRNEAVKNAGYEQVVTISKQFQKINQNNINIQSDIADILKTTEIYANASEPLQVMCLGFQQLPQLRNQLWEKIVDKHSNKFQNLSKTKQNFFNFGYIDALMLFAEKNGPIAL